MFVEERIERQKRIIDELAETRRETDCAVSMLHALETCLRALEQHRKTIFERCEASWRQAIICTQPSIAWTKLTIDVSHRAGAGND